MFDPRTARLYASAAASTLEVGTTQFVSRRGTYSKAGHAAWLADSGYTCVLDRSTFDLCLGVVSTPVCAPARNLPRTANLLGVMAIQVNRVI